MGKIDLIVYKCYQKKYFTEKNKQKLLLILF